MKLRIESRPWQTNAALLLIGAGMFALARQLVSEYDHFTIGFSGVSGWSATLYILACVTILIGKTDHISPYRYVPGDPALHLLRAPNLDIFDNINRRDYARTIYPPAAQLLFYVITAISPTVTFMKTVMVLFEGLTMYALIQLLAALGIRREQSLLYAWCPLLIWEIAGSGHLDSVAMALIALALLARARNHPIATGLFLALAILTKMYPIILLPALYRRGDWKMPATVAALIAVGYAAYASVGTLVFGFLFGYAQEEGLDTGVRYFLLDWTHRLPGLHTLPNLAFYLFCAAMFAALTLWSWRTAAQPDSPPLAFLPPAFGFAAALMLLFSPHYAWYIAWLVPFFCLLPNLLMLVYLMGFFYGYTTALADPGPKMFLLNEYLYTAVLTAILLHLGLRLWPRAKRIQPAKDRYEQVNILAPD